jgi:hypothetical protein
MKESRDHLPSDIRIYRLKKILRELSPERRRAFLKTLRENSGTEALHRVTREEGHDEKA